VPKLAPMSAVLKKEYESKIESEIPAGEDVTILFDTTFPLKPDIDSWETDQDGLTVQSIQKFKDRVKVRFNQNFQVGKRLKLKVKPKRLI